MKLYAMYDHVISNWGAVLGNLLILAPLICIPVFVLVSLCKNPLNMGTPSGDLRQARPNKPLLTLCGCVIFEGQAAENKGGVMMVEPGEV